MRGALAALALLLSGCATTAEHAAFGREAEVYDPAADADAAVTSALDKARQRGVNTLVVLGANWCHDSRALAAWSQQPRNAALLAERFETVFVDVAEPQSGRGRNGQILARYGLPAETNTPLVLVIAPSGAVLNAATAASWKNAASRPDAAIYDELAAFPLPAEGR